jgi:3-oxoacyl-[acyl-carrier-protein] synthase III
MPIQLLGTGSYTPEKILTNRDLEKMVDTNDEWITTRTGIRERRIATAEQATSDLALMAASRALSNAGVAADELDVILIATCTPDMAFPSTATLVQHQLGATNAFAMDLSAACSGFIFGLETARNLLESGRYRTALVIGAEKMSSLLDWQDRGTCILFGDGAGAAVLRREEGSLGGLGPCILGSNVLAERSNTITMAGQEVFKHAVLNMTDTAKRLLKLSEWDPSELALVIPHQANQRILEAIRTRVGVDKDNVFVNVDKYGNTSAASIGIALDEAVAQGRLKPGDRVMLLAFGAGFTWGGLLLEWRTPA